MAIRDQNYLKPSFRLSEIEHKYGKNFHLLSDPYLFTILAKLCAPECRQPMVNSLLTILYQELVRIVVASEFPTLEAVLHTRMRSLHAEGEYQARIVDPKTQVVCVNLARAGTVPSQICFDFLNYLLNPDGVRQDHISINRKIDDHEQVVGTHLGGLKIGGDVQDRIVLFPDPMGATGSTLKTAMEIYGKRGTALKYVAMHLVVTPEYLRLASEHLPELAVYAIRLDRGLSDPKVLNSVPGTFWNEERGLNAKQYIVPGGGGLGEVINNSYV